MDVTRLRAWVEVIGHAYYKLGLAGLPPPTEGAATLPRRRARQGPNTGGPPRGGACKFLFPYGYTCTFDNTGVVNRTAR